MNILFKSYEDLTNQIAIIELRLSSYKKQKELTNQLKKDEEAKELVDIEYSGSYKTYLKELRILEGHILLHEEELNRLHEEQRLIDKLFSMLKGNEERIFYYRIIEGLTQEQTAEKMYMSVRQIQRIEKRIKEKMYSC